MATQPHETLWALTTAVVASRSLHVIAELGVADHVADEPVPAGELAARCDADADALDRVLRLLAAHGVFRHSTTGYAHTDASRLLRSDHPMSMRAFPRMFGLSSFTASFSHLDHAVRSGRPGLECVDPRGLWGYLQDQPDEADIFGQAMASKAAADIAAVLAAYDFGGFATIADIGGGRGHLLAAILATTPSATGVLFDLPAVTDTVDVDASRLTIEPGDFFTDPLPNADCYVLMEVIHDWDDQRSVAILDAVRRAAPGGATVLIIEGVVTEDPPDPRVHTLDVVMLTITGGRERTASELGSLLEGAGFRPERVIETAGAMRIVEAVSG